MFKNLKIFISGGIAGVMLTATVGVTFAEPIEKAITALYNDIKIYIDGTMITPKDSAGNTVEPFIYDGTTYLPVRAVSEAFGKQVEWDEQTNSVRISTPGTSAPAEIYTVGTVDNQPIYSDEFEFFLQIAKNEIEMEESPADAEAFWQSGEVGGVKAREAANSRAFNLVKANKVQTNKAAENGIELTEEDRQAINETKNRYMSQWGGSDGYNEFLRMQGLTDRAFGQILEDQYISSKLYDKLVNRDKVIEVSEQEINDYMEQNKDSLRIKAQHILFMTLDTETGQPYSEEQVEEIRVKAEAVLTRINAGEDFETLMAEYNEDPGVAQQPEGYVFGKGEMVPEFEQAAYNLEPNGISELVKTSFGYHIIKRVDAPASEINPADDIKEQILNTKYSNMVDEWIGESVLEENAEGLGKINF